MSHEHRRDSDSSIWLRTSETLAKYKLLVWAIVALLLAFGFDFKTPSSISKELQAQITASATRIAALERVNTGVERKLDALILLQCFELAHSSRQRELSLAGLNCPPTPFPAAR